MAITTDYERTEVERTSLLDSFSSDSSIIENRNYCLNKQNAVNKKLKINDCLSRQRIMDNV